MIFGILRVFAVSTSSSIDAKEVFQNVGFVGEKGTEKIIKWGKPNVGERFVLKVKMVINNAGTFEMFRQSQGSWTSLYTGRITSLESNDSGSTKSSTVLSKGFSIASNSLRRLNPYVKISKVSLLKSLPTARMMRAGRSRFFRMGQRSV